jgi:hypothetical protein
LDRNDYPDSDIVPATYIASSQGLEDVLKVLMRRLKLNKGLLGAIALVWGVNAKQANSAPASAARDGASSSATGTHGSDGSVPRSSLPAIKPFGAPGREKSILTREAAAARVESGNIVTIPTPSGPEWEALKTRYGLPDPAKVDTVKSKVTLPPGWSIRTSKDDPRHKSVVDESGNAMGTVFIKDSGYDYYGHTRFTGEVDH